MPINVKINLAEKRKICFVFSKKNVAQMYGSDSKADQFEIWIDSQYPFSDTDHNQASSVNSSVLVAGLYWLSKLNPKTCFYKWLSNNKSLTKIQKVEKNIQS